MILARNGKAAARLVRFDPAPGRVIFGLAKGECTAPTDEAWAAMDREIEAMFLGDNDKLHHAAE